MATTTTKESEVFVPEGQPDPVVVASEQGTAIVFGGQTSGISVDAKTGTTSVSGEKTTDSTFTVGSGANLVFADYKLKKSDVIGPDGNGSVDVEGTVAKKTTFDLAEGNDSITFGDGAVIKKSSISMGGGSDSITFQASSKVNKTEIDLGDDVAIDTINIQNGAEVNNLKIRNFKPGDQLIIGGETFNADDVVNGKIDGFNFITFE
ncbi:MAG: hypothetical protein ACKO5F_16830 [Synechococcus sp.]